jgi:ADP-dependent NAD(P)H-hydrate dehydratase
MDEALVANIERITTLPEPPERPIDGHKGTFGSVLVVAGSEGMSGAACLTGRAALHGGAGLVTVAIPRCILHIVATGHPSYMTLPLPDADGCLSVDAVEPINTAVKKRTAIAIGPGLGQNESVRHVIHHVYQHCSQPMVVDADALNAFATATEKLSDRPDKAPRILTPHPGEFSRLTGYDTISISKQREKLAIEFARRYRVILLLKGENSIITDGHSVAVNPTGDTGLATGGSGDVLTGLIASLLAQGMDAFDAAQLGAYLHGLAGECASARLTDRYVTSLEIVNHLHLAWQRYPGINQPTVD